MGDEVSACKTTTDGRAAMELPRRRWHLPHEAAILRLVGYWVSGFVFYLGYIWIFVDKRKRGWFDLIAGTVVIKAPN